MLDFTDNGLDPRSGTIRQRATLANPDLFLTPGMFGDMRLASAGSEQALLVPDTAIASDLTPKIVFWLLRTMLPRRAPWNSAHWSMACG